MTIINDSIFRDPDNVGPLSNLSTSDKSSVVNAINEDVARRKDLGINVKDYGASGSTTWVTGSMSAGSNILNLAWTIDFVNGQGITIANAGSPCTLSTPVWASTPITATGSGTQTYIYQIVAIDTNGGCSAASIQQSITNSSTLSTSSYNTLSWNTVSSALAYAIYGTIPSSGTVQLLDITDQITWNDVGMGVAKTIPFYLPTQPPTSALAGILTTNIVSGAGTTTMILGTSAISNTNGNVMVMHDDSAAFQLALQAATNSVLRIPTGKYNISKVLLIPPTTKIDASGSSNTQLYYIGVPGGGIITDSHGGTFRSMLVSDKGGTATTPVMQSENASENTYITLNGFRIIFPYCLILSSTRVVYLRVPNGPITDLLIVDDSTQGPYYAPVSGSIGVDLDGCTNAVTFVISTSGVSAHLDKPWNVRCNHVSFVGSNSGFGNSGIYVDQDTVSSSAGPPWNVNLFGFHGYQLYQALLNVNKSTHVSSYGGLNESSQGYNLITQASNNGTVVMEGMYTTGASISATRTVSLLRQSTTDKVHFNDTQNGYFYDVNGASPFNRTSKRVFISQGSSYTTNSTTPRVALMNYNQTHNGGHRGYYVRTSGYVSSDTVGAAITLQLMQGSQSAGIGDPSPSGGGIVQNITLTQPNLTPIANPATSPTLSTAATGGSIAGGITVYCKYTWTNANGETQASPEASISIPSGTSTNTVTVTIPSLPAGITSANIYMSTSTGTETKQGSTTGTTYTQSAALGSGASLPATNTASYNAPLPFVLEYNLISQDISSFFWLTVHTNSGNATVQKANIAADAY